MKSLELVKLSIKTNILTAFQTKKLTKSLAEMSAEAVQHPEYQRDIERVNISKE